MKNIDAVSKKTNTYRVSNPIKTKASKSSASLSNLTNFSSAHQIANPVIQILELNRSDLEKMTPQELVANYSKTEQHIIQGRLQQCQILREIRIKFGENDRRFGEFISTTILSELPGKTVNRMIQVADFFEAKAIEGIAWSSALALAEPRNRPVALKVYKEIAGKNSRPVDVVARIDKLMERQQQPKMPRKTQSIIEGKFTNIKEAAITEVKVELTPSNEITKALSFDRPVLTLRSPRASALIPRPENPDSNLSESEFQLAVEAIAKQVRHLSNTDRARLWRALIRRDEK